MEKLRINISGSIGDEGWKSSVIQIAEEATDKLKSKCGDVRGAMGFLGTLEAYRVIDAEQGVYYNKIFANTADTRGGFIQVSCFVPTGYRPKDVEKIYSVLNNVLDEREIYYIKKI